MFHHAWLNTTLKGLTHIIAVATTKDNFGQMYQGKIQDFFKGGSWGNSYTIYKNYIYIAIIHIIILINKVHVSTYCA